MMRIAFATLTAAALLAAMPAAAETGYLKITAQKQGQIKGEVTSKGGMADSLAVLDMDWSMSVPTVNGVATGRRVQQPISFTVRWSKATPLLLQAATDNETLSKVDYSGWLPNIDGVGAGAGTESMRHTISLTNAHIVSLKITDRKTDSDLLDPVVVVTMSYQSLAITETNGGITAMDDWTNK